MLEVCQPWPNADGETCLHVPLRHSFLLRQIGQAAKVLVVEHHHLAPEACSLCTQCLGNGFQTYPGHLCGGPFVIAEK